MLVCVCGGEEGGQRTCAEEGDRALCCRHCTQRSTSLSMPVHLGEDDSPHLRKSRCHLGLPASLARAASIAMDGDPS